jgi:hypothetical protein
MVRSFSVSIRMKSKAMAYLSAFRRGRSMGRRGLPRSVLRRARPPRPPRCADAAHRGFRRSARAGGRAPRLRASPCGDEGGEDVAHAMGHGRSHRAPGRCGRAWNPSRDHLQDTGFARAPGRRRDEDRRVSLGPSDLARGVAGGFPRGRRSLPASHDSSNRFGVSTSARGRSASRIAAAASGAM